jgi:hypothetical protein
MKKINATITKFALILLSFLLVGGSVIALKHSASDPVIEPGGEGDGS